MHLTIFTLTHFQLPNSIFAHTSSYDHYSFFSSNLCPYIVPKADFNGMDYSADNFSMILLMAAILLYAQSLFFLDSSVRTTNSVRSLPIYVRSLPIQSSMITTNPIQYDHYQSNQVRSLPIQSSTTTTNISTITTNTSTITTILTKYLIFLKINFTSKFRRVC